MRDILRAFVKAGVGSGANLVVGLARNKLVAHYLGPQGMGLVSLLQQFQTTLLPIATLGGDPPLVQGLSSRSGEERDAFLASAFLALLSSWSLCAIAVALWGDGLGSLLLGNALSNSPLVVSLMCIPITATAFSNFLMALLTCVGAVGSFQKGQLAGNIAGLAAAIPLGLLWDSGNRVLIIFFIASTPIASIACAFWYINKIPKAASLLKAIRTTSFRLDLLRSFLTFGTVTIITGFTVTVTWLLIRREILRILGPDALGFFSAAISLSGLGLSILSTALYSFYLPRFAAADRLSRPQLIKSVLLLVLPVALLVFVVLQTVPSGIVRLLFSERFLPMVPLLRWWVAGDLVRAISYVFAIPIFSGAHIKFVFLSETIFASLLLGSIVTSLRLGGGLIYSGAFYFSVYVLYLVTVVVYARVQSYI